MIRLFGILTGSAIAVAILIVVLGLPEFTATPTVPEPEFEPVVTTEPAPSAEMAEAPETVAAPIDLEFVAEAQPDEELVPETDSETAAPTEPTTPIEYAPQANDAKWYAFWSPFRSEVAADGFVAELQRTTGLDYRVVKLKPGVYEVAFAYLDEGDIQDKLVRISTATGLDLSGG